MASERYAVRTVEVYPNADDSRGTFTLDDDEQILDASMRRINQQSAAVEIAVLSPTTASRCMATTGEGTRCERDATQDSDYCSIPSHGPDE